MRRGEKVVGIIGGMGPEATVDFMRRLIAATPARDDHDHLHVLADNNSKVPSRIAALIEGTGEDPAPVLCEMAKGLEIPGNEAPDYMDFAYFAFVIGMTFQVSDIQISSRQIRRVVLAHGILSFLFNTVIVALTINVVVNLKG